jgi:hypothetical protein
MGGAYKQGQKSRSIAADLLPARALSEQLTARLSSAAGISKLRTRDPVYALSELFKTRFDSFGATAAEQKEEREQSEDSKTADAQTQNGGFSDISKTETQKAVPDFPSYAHSSAQISQRDFYHRFSQTAFNNGKLAGAILQGGGKGMFVSCLKRAFGISMTPTDRQKTVFADNAANLPIVNFPARVVFNRCVHGAASVVFDSAMEADRMLELLSKLATADTDCMLKSSLPDSYRQLFPFLSTEADTALRDALQATLSGLDTPEGSTQETVQKRAMLGAALKKTDAIISRKNQMKTDFTVHLREILNQLHKAEEFYSSDTLVTEIVDELLGPKEPNDDNSDDDNNNKKKHRRSGQKNANSGK